MDYAIATSAALGGVVGLILALTGAGGGILAVPLLLFVLGLGIAEAAPIALLAVALAAGIGAVMGLRLGIVRYRAAALMAGLGMLASPLGLWLARRVPNTPLTVLFAAVLAYVAVRMFRQTVASQGRIRRDAPATPQPCHLDNGSGRFVWTAACTRALAFTGLGAGFLSGLLGVGGGFVIVPALKKATDAPLHAIVATSLAVITLVSIAGVVSTSISGHMNWSIGAPFAAGAVAGMLGGRLIADRLSGPRLQQAFALLAGSIAVGMTVRVVLAS
jgi:uncharacterized membrane protein YfcA